MQFRYCYIEGEVYGSKELPIDVNDYNVYGDESPCKIMRDTNDLP